MPLFESARTESVAQGIGCIARAGANGIELDFEIAPHAKLSNLQLRLRGQSRPTLDANGDLAARNGHTEFRLRHPEIYQIVDGRRQTIPGGYAVGRSGQIFFDVPVYDHTRPLVIDPSVSLTYTTFLGGSGTDSAGGVAVDSSGNVYLGGAAAPVGFPESSNSIGPGGGASEFFVAKIDPTQTGAASLIYLTFIGGSGSQTGGQLAVDPNGDVAITGSTTSSNYPVTDKSALGSSANALALSELNSEGNSLVLSTVLAGNGSEGTEGNPAVAFTPAGDLIVAADTSSTNLPVTAGAFNAVYGGGTTDGFLAVYSSTGTLTYLTYFGINATVGVTSIAVDLLSQAYVTGFTSNPGTTFPTTNGFQATYGGDPFDAILMCFSPKGLGTSDLIYSTFLGGNSLDQGFSVAVDGAIPANAYVVGTTESSNIDSTPAITGYQSTLAGTANAFLAVVSQTSAGVTSLSYATYFGGSASDAAFSVFALGENSVYVAGHASSPNFPIYQTLQSFSGTSDAFVAKFDSTQSSTASLLYSTLLGGRNDSQANGIAATATGSVFVAGSTTSPDFPLAGNPQTGFQPICTSCQETPPFPDAFLVALAENETAGPIVQFNAPELNAFCGTRNNSRGNTNRYIIPPANNVKGHGGHHAPSSFRLPSRELDVLRNRQPTPLEVVEDIGRVPERMAVPM